MKKLVKTLLTYLMHLPTILFISHGRHVFIGASFSCRRPKYIELGNNVSLGKRCRIYCYDNYANVPLSPSIVIGPGSMFGDDCRFLVADRLTVGKNVLAASYILVTTENHGMNCDLSYSTQPLVTGPVEIGDECWIGEGVTIMPGVKIGNKAIIGAGSVVNRDVPAYTIAVGNPARIVKRWNEDASRWERIEERER